MHNATFIFYQLNEHHHTEVGSKDDRSWGTTRSLSNVCYIQCVLVNSLHHFLVNNPYLTCPLLHHHVPLISTIVLKWMEVDSSTRKNILVQYT